MSKTERSILQFLNDILEFSEDLQNEIATISYEKFVNNKMAILFAERNFEKKNRRSCFTNTKERP